jgi:hypothetical protein
MLYEWRAYGAVRSWEHRHPIIWGERDDEWDILSPSFGKEKDAEPTAGFLSDVPFPNPKLRPRKDKRQKWVVFVEPILNWDAQLSVAVSSTEEIARQIGEQLQREYPEELKGLKLDAASLDGRTLRRLREAFAPT